MIAKAAFLKQREMRRAKFSPPKEATEPTRARYVFFYFPVRQPDDTREEDEWEVWFQYSQ